MLVFLFYMLLLQNGMLWWDASIFFWGDSIKVRYIFNGGNYISLQTLHFRHAFEVDAYQIAFLQNLKIYLGVQCTTGPGFSFEKSCKNLRKLFQLLTYFRGKIKENICITYVCVVKCFSIQVHPNGMKNVNIKLVNRIQDKQTDMTRS